MGGGCYGSSPLTSLASFDLTIRWLMVAGRCRLRSADRLPHNLADDRHWLPAASPWVIVASGLPNRSRRSALAPNRGLPIGWSVAAVPVRLDRQLGRQGQVGLTISPLWWVSAGRGRPGGRRGIWTARGC